MVSHLATELVNKFANNATRILDPFCGSGAILVASRQRGIPTTGIDLNPVAFLLSSVKSLPFDRDKAIELCRRLVTSAKTCRRPMLINWPSKRYWFTDGTLSELEKLRFAARQLDLQCSPEGNFVLLALAMTVRPCSRADQRSPKPFISKIAIEDRKWKHYDPYKILLELGQVMGDCYGSLNSTDKSAVILSDFNSSTLTSNFIGSYSHVITSPPYINAQDYFRNFKLEMYILEGLLDFEIKECKEKMIGTERGNLRSNVDSSTIARNLKMVTGLRQIETKSARLASTIHSYFKKMDDTIEKIYTVLGSDGKFVLVCGDNLIAGQRIKTWKILSRLAEERGFKLYDKFSDKIQNRSLPPKRSGHKGLIKEEVILAFSKA